MTVASLAAVKSFQELSCQLTTANDIAVLRLLLAKTADTLGFSFYSYVGGVLAAGERLQGITCSKRPVVISNVDERFYRAYSEGRLDSHDPVLRAGMRLSAPASWSRLIDLDKASAAERQVVYLGYDFNMYDGVVFPVHGPGNDFGIFSFALTRKQSSIALDYLTTALLQLFAEQFHQVVSRLFFWPSSSKNAVSLSVREIDVLQWLGEGKTKWEVAKILGISEHTVGDHIRNARQKLNAVNQTQVVARMMSLRLNASSVNL